MKLLKLVKYLTFIIYSILLQINCNQKINVFSAFAQEKNDTNIYEKIDAYLSDAVKKAHFPAMSITIVDSKQTLLSKTYGDITSSDTPFVLGSVSKSFTALAIMQLVEKQKIDLDQLLSFYIPTATDGNQITIKQLLNHTSGLGEHQNLRNYKIVNPQGKHVYANVNYSLLGNIIENVSGLKYEDYLTQHIFHPLQMKNTSATKTDALIDSYRNWFGIPIQTKPKYPQNDNAWITTPAGYLSSSTTDLGKYLQMYLNHGNGIISNESIQKMFYDNVAVNASIPYYYGMGWTLIKEPLKHPALRHSGLVETNMSVIYLLPDNNIGIAMTINCNDYFVGKDMMDRMDWSVVLMLMNEQPNQISQREYFLKHFLYDSLYLSIFILSIIPLCRLSSYKRNLLKGRLWFKFTSLILLHLFLPIFLLTLPQFFFNTPLWVVASFVPDLWVSILLSSILLFLGGIIKTIFWIFKLTKRQQSEMLSNK